MAHESAKQQLLSVFYLLAVASPFSSAGFIRKRCNEQSEMDAESSKGVKIEALNISRIQVDSLEREFKAGHYLTLEFKATSESGLLFYARRKDDASQFVFIHLEEGYLFYRIHCPKTHANLLLTGTARFSDGEWHKLYFRRRNNRAVLEVDGVRYFRDYDVSCDGFDSVILGGVDPNKQDEISMAVKRAGHFEGCLRELRTSMGFSTPPLYYAVSSCV